MKGWVYVISNKAMPGLVKVGYSEKDPEQRAKELDHTGAPYPYIVEYEILVEEPYEIEQRVHQILSRYLEGKEWFRCSSEEAVDAIRRVAGGRAISESFKKADREKAERLQRERELEIAKQQEKRIRETELLKKEQEIIRKYNNLLKAKFPGPGVRGFFLYWLGSFLLIFFASIPITMLSQKHLSDSQFLGTILLGVLFAIYWTWRKKEKQKGSDEYCSLIRERDAELEAIKKRRQELSNDF